MTQTDNTDGADLDEAVIQYEAIRQRGDVNMWNRHKTAEVAAQLGMDDLATIANHPDQDQYRAFLEYYLDSPVSFADSEEATWTVTDE